MSPEDSSLLASIGQGLVYHIAFNNLESTILWGGHAGLTVAALVSLRRRRDRTRLLTFLFVILFLLLVLSTCVMALDWACSLTLIQYELVKNVNLELADRVILAKAKASPILAPVRWLRGGSGLMFLIGDIVVITRGYMLWMRSKWFFTFPIFLCLASFTFTLAGILQVPKGVGVVANTSIIAILGINAIACSIVSNALVTALIAYQAFTHRRIVKDSHGVVKSRALTVLLYLVEAGLLYFLIQLIALILSLLDVEIYSRIDYAANGVSVLNYYISITYPAIVILIVAHNRSLANEGTASGPTFNIGTHLSFSGPGTTAANTSQSPTSSHKEGIGGLPIWRVNVDGDKEMEGMAAV